MAGGERHVLAGARGGATLPVARARSGPPGARPTGNEPHEGAAPGNLGLAAACATALGSAAVTEALGLHHVLGAFLAGVAIPGAARRAILVQLEAPVAVALMPFFFVLTGLRTTIDLGSGTFVAVFLLMTLAATVGKFGGTALMARAAGEGWPTALGLGALMQTKGLMEVLVLTVMLDAGLIAAGHFLGAGPDGFGEHRRHDAPHPVGGAERVLGALVRP